MRNRRQRAATGIGQGDLASFMQLGRGTQGRCSVPSSNSRAHVGVWHRAGKARELICHPPHRQALAQQSYPRVHRILEQWGWKGALEVTSSPSPA